MPDMKYIQGIVETAAPYFALGYVTFIAGLTAWGLTRHKKKQGESPLEENVRKHEAGKPVLRDISDYTNDKSA